ncbi:hypothetical protein [Xanthomonas sp. 4461]|uniref:Chloride channel protein n=1 Tax=Xanthomonas sp. 10-10 TaxID=3115848 RepID=A0AAU7P8B2_9XANT|nr:hypothetical protein [Xanthomonas sp. 4461]MCS3809591.1 hypothetical protein [Xanthomonas sp. 4461]
MFSQRPSTLSRRPSPTSNRQAWHDLPDLQHHHARRRRLTQLRWMAGIAGGAVAALWAGPLLWSCMCRLLA